MAFSLHRLLKGILVSEENALSPKQIAIIPGGAAGTTTTVTSSQTADVTITLPDESGVVLTGQSVIDFDQLETLPINRAIISDSNGVITASDVTSTEISYLDGVTAAIQTQIDGKANVSLNNLGTTAINGDLIPGVNALRNLGSSVRTWATGFIGSVVTNNITKPSDSSVVLDVDNRVLKAPSSVSMIDFSTTAVNVLNHKIINLATPTDPTDATTKAYVDAAAAGGGANLSLSNLNATSINQSLNPSAYNTYSLGLGGKDWSQLNVLNIGSTSHSGVINVSGLKVTDTTGSDSILFNARQLVSSSTVKLDYSGTDVSLNTRKLTNVVTPTASTDAANKAYVDLVNRTLKINGIGSTPVPVNSFGITVPFTTTVRNDFGGTPYSAGIVTIPVTGKYFITCKVGTIGTLGVNDFLTLQINKNGSAVSADLVAGNGSATVYVAQITDQLDLVSGDLIRVNVTTDQNTIIGLNTQLAYLVITYLGT